MCDFYAKNARQLSKTGIYHIMLRGNEPSSLIIGKLLKR
ncbi:hypothetical protein SpAn4DRAFT_2783 [Sporomusa ovata]|uniref:Uncharacterized protein n=1 Tax=Sporomusa ovata TaxID=2378 RepID=A0A0U1KZF1_9FIRM|nr:hypothetical protein SpAn4DRAFT_2783 [Sporomusa ovata]